MKFQLPVTLPATTMQVASSLGLYPSQISGMFARGASRPTRKFPGSRAYQWHEDDVRALCDWIARKQALRDAVQPVGSEPVEGTMSSAAVCRRLGISRVTLSVLFRRGAPVPPVHPRGRGYLWTEESFRALERWYAPRRRWRRRQPSVVVDAGVVGTQERNDLPPYRGAGSDPLTDVAHMVGTVIDAILNVVVGLRDSLQERYAADPKTASSGADQHRHRMLATAFDGIRYCADVVDWARKWGGSDRFALARRVAEKLEEVADVRPHRPIPELDEQFRREARAASAELLRGMLAYWIRIGEPARAEVAQVAADVASTDDRAIVDKIHEQAGQK